MTAEQAGCKFCEDSCVVVLFLLVADCCVITTSANGCNMFCVAAITYFGANYEGCSGGVLYREWMSRCASCCCACLCGGTPSGVVKFDCYVAKIKLKGMRSLAPFMPAS